MLRVAQRWRWLPSPYLLLHLPRLASEAECLVLFLWLLVWMFTVAIYVR